VDNLEIDAGFQASRKFKIVDNLLIVTIGMWTMEYANINEFFYEPFPQAITINKFFLKKDKKKDNIF
jgi:hypothetical protein